MNILLLQNRLAYSFSIHQFLTAVPAVTSPIACDQWQIEAPCHKYSSHLSREALAGNVWFVVYSWLRLTYKLFGWTAFFPFSQQEMSFLLFCFEALKRFLLICLSKSWDRSNWSAIELIYALVSPFLFGQHGIIMPICYWGKGWQEHTKNSQLWFLYKLLPEHLYSVIDRKT